MNRQIIAAIAQQGGQILSEYFRTYTRRKIYKEDIESQNQVVVIGKTDPAPELARAALDYIPPKSDQELADEAKSIESGCVPCALGHLGTCSGLLAEALRYGRKDGITSPEVIERASMCLDELNAMERVDLRPEKMATLVDWEKSLAYDAANASRATRHALEGLTSIDGLEKAAAALQTSKKEISQKWFKNHIDNLENNPEAEHGRQSEM